MYYSMILSRCYYKSSFFLIRNPVELLDLFYKFCFIFRLHLGAIQWQEWSWSGLQTFHRMVDPRCAYDGRKLLIFFPQYCFCLSGSEHRIQGAKLYFYFNHSAEILIRRLKNSKAPSKHQKIGHLMPPIKKLFTSINWQTSAFLGGC